MRLNIDGFTLRRVGLRRLARRILSASARSAGYVVDGNHVFARADHADIQRGRWRESVAERPQAHPPKARRIARLVAATY